MTTLFQCEVIKTNVQIKAVNLELSLIRNFRKIAISSWNV